MNLREHRIDGTLCAAPHRIWSRVPLDTSGTTYVNLVEAQRAVLDASKRVAVHGRPAREETRGG